MFSDVLFAAGRALLGEPLINRIAIDRLVKAAPARPHAWSTQFDDYICWSGLTDKSYFARLLPPGPPPQEERIGTSCPPVEELKKLFPAKPGQQIASDKSTCLFPAFAQYLTDGFLRTRMFNSPPGPHTQNMKEDRRRTTSNHEIDLSALYGRNDAQTNKLRTFNGGRLKSQILNGEEFPCFLYAEKGDPKPEFCDENGILVLDEPLGVELTTPGRATFFAVGGDRVNASLQVATINTLFLREHNRLAGELQRRNPDWGDERLFQTARNILIVEFIVIVVNEYINHISSAPFAFDADPSAAWNVNWNRPNWMTIEFTLLYRWHSLVPETMTWNGTQIGSAQTLRNNQLLIDGGLANAMVEISANKSARMGLGNFASFLIDVEAKGIRQGRANRVQGYNAYRRAMSLAPARTFADVVGSSGDRVEQARRQALAKDLERLYGIVDNLEFYVGLFAEPCQPNSPAPELLLAMVAMDAFSQALTNPLLSQQVWGDPANRNKAFSDFGVKEISRTNRLRDVLERNCQDLGDRFVGMTQKGWSRS